MYAQVPPHRLEALAELAVAVEVGDAALLELREHFLHPDQHAGQPHLRQAAGALERDQHDLVDVRVPVLLRPPAEVPAADQPGLVVVGAEIGRARMRHLDRDQRNVGFAVLRRDDRRHVLVGLEFDDQVDFLPDQDVGVALGDFRVVAVVDADELDPLGGGGRAAARSRSPSRTGSRCPGRHIPAGRGVAGAAERRSGTGSRRPFRSFRSVRVCTAAGTPCSSEARCGRRSREAAAPRPTIETRTAAARNGRPI